MSKVAEIFMMVRTRFMRATVDMRGANVKSERPRRLSQSGQIAVEYVLLLLVGLGIYILIANTMVSRNPSNPGFVIDRWQKIVRVIGHDIIEK